MYKKSMSYKPTLGFASEHTSFTNVWRSHEGRRAFLQHVQEGLEEKFESVPPLHFSDKMRKILDAATIFHNEESLFPIPEKIKAAIEYAVEAIANEAMMKIRIQDMRRRGHASLPMRPSVSGNERRKDLPLPELSSYGYEDFLSHNFGV